METDDLDNIYIGGSTSSSGICFNGFDVTHNGISDAVIAKFDKNGNHIWSTYYGGSSIDEGFSVTVDNSYNIYLAGTTGSTNLLNAAGTLNGLSDAFILKINPSGTFNSARYLGGNKTEQTPKVSYDKIDNNLYCALRTNSNTSLLTGTVHDNTLNGMYDIYLTKINPATLSQYWGTYFGGIGNEEVNNCLFFNNNPTSYPTPNNDIAFCGSTNSSSGISYNSNNNTLNPTPNQTDAYVAVFKNDGTIRWASYFGGNGNDKAYDLILATYATDYSIDLGNGNANSPIILVGSTESTNNIFVPESPCLLSPIEGTTLNGLSDGFFTVFNAFGEQYYFPGDNNAKVVKSRYYGGIYTDFISSITNSHSGSLIALFTNSPNMALNNYFDNTLNSSGQSDVLIAELSQNCNLEILRASYLGGEGEDVPLVIKRLKTVTPSSQTSCYIFGVTSSSGLGLNGYDNTYGGGSYDYFLSRINWYTMQARMNSEKKESNIPYLDNSISIFPNPINSNSILNIRFDKNNFYPENFSLKLYDLLGNEIKFFEQKLSNNEIQLKLTNIASGTYVLQLISNEIKLSKRIIIQ